MESFQILKAQSEEKLRIAEHLISTTYPLVREPKLFISVIENIFQSLDLAITSVLEHEKIFQNIPSYNNTFESKFEIFRRKIKSKYSINEETIKFITEMHNILNEHKKSSVEFTKKEKFVISDNDYNIKTLTADEVKKLMIKAKRIIGGLFKITN